MKKSARILFFGHVLVQVILGLQSSAFGKNNKNGNITTLKRMGDLKSSRINIEPSGIIYVPSLKKSLLVSDDNVNDSPLVYLVNQENMIEERAIRIKGIPEISDMEGITTDENGSIYIASSQSPKKNGKLPSKRTYFLKLKIKNETLEVERSIFLYEKLNNIARKNRGLDWVKLLPTSKRKSKKRALEMDVEGIVVNGGNLYLGLRNHIKKDNIIILKISDLQMTLETGRLQEEQVSIWKKIPLDKFHDKTINEGISDLYLHHNRLMILIADNGHKTRGRLLSMPFNGKGKIIEHFYFKKNRPEGITYNPLKGVFTIVFDENSGLEQEIMELKIKF